MIEWRPTSGKHYAWQTVYAPGTTSDRVVIEHPGPMEIRVYGENRYGAGEAYTCTYGGNTF